MYISERSKEQNYSLFLEQFTFLLKKITIFEHSFLLSFTIVLVAIMIEVSHNYSQDTVKDMYK